MLRWLLFCFMIFAGVLRLAAQVPSRAVKFYHKALSYQQKHQSVRAEEAMRKAIRAYPAYKDAYSLLGKWYFDKHQFRAAADVFVIGERACTDGRSLFGKATTTSLLYSGDYVQALQRLPSNAQDAALKQLRAQALFMQAAMRPRRGKDSVAVSPVGTPLRINSGDPEFFPFITADGQRLYYTRRVNGMDDDLYYAERDSCGGWLAGRNMGNPPNTSAAESAQAISADRHYLFMMRCDNRSENGWDQGGCDLYMAYTADSIWTIPLSFGATINTPDFEGMPTLSSDNRELFFVSDRPGGYGKMDLWSSRFEHGLWQLPRNLGPNINTAGSETAPFIYADNNSLYFASTGHTGIGGSDLFVSHKINDTTWGPAVNLGFPINSVYDEVSVNLNAQGDTLYLASDRDSLAGHFDIYQATLPASLKPGAVGFYNGRVYDSLSQAPLNYANIYFTDAATGQEVYQVVSNRGDGSYTIALAAGHHYALLISRIGYQQMTDTINCDTGDVAHPITHNFSMLPFGYEKPTRDTTILSVFFQRNVASLNDSDRVLIAQILSPWLLKNEISIFVNGYTDNTGTPMINEQLSFTRARAVGDLIKTLGFREELLHIQGWGEANPLTDNGTDEARDRNRRVEIVIRQ